MILSTMAFTYERSTVVDFVPMPIWTNDFVGMYYYNGETEFGGWYFVQPFKVEVWILLALSIVIICVLMASIKKAQATFQHNSVRQFSLYISLLTNLIGASLRQGR